MGAKLNIYTTAKGASLKVYRKDLEVNFIPMESKEVIRRNVLKRSVSFVKALAMGKKVDDRIRLERESICLKCHYLNKRNRCSLCGCKVRQVLDVLNLSAYEENLPDWGCKHPLRLVGKGWPLNDEARKYHEDRKELLELRRKAKNNGK